MLFSAFTDILEELMSPHREQRAWGIWALPLNLYERLSPDALLCGADAGYISLQLLGAGVRRDVAGAWPQRIGFNVALKLAERGRVAFGLFSSRRDVFRATRKRPGEFNEHVVRVEVPKFLAALRTAGASKQKTPRGVAVAENEGH